MSFGSDNWAGASDRVANAIAVANEGPAQPYGKDRWTEQAIEALGAYFEREVAVYFVATGSAANALALAHLYRPGGVTIVHTDSHVACDEAGGPLFHSPGMMLDCVDGPAGRLLPGDVAARIARYGGGSPREGRVTTLSFANVNELGQAYSALEVSALTGVAREHGVAVHVDGARFANALAFTGASPADLTWRCGVDVMSLGFTKTGGWCAEAVVFFDLAAGEAFAYRHQQAGHVLSKSRFVAAQFIALVEDGHATALAAQANTVAADLASVIDRSESAALAVPCQSNEVFAFVAPQARDRMEHAEIAFHRWGLRSGFAPPPPHPDWSLCRFVASHRTDHHEVERVARMLLSG